MNSSNSSSKELNGVDAVARATSISPGPGLDAVLNWGGGVNNYHVEPGGEKDTSSLPGPAAQSTGLGVRRTDNTNPNG
jgi:hypothetical protein